ncbi:TIGR03435 family protein [Pseudoflavitalea sp. X16]|uniref:TIGR03435 family protein n=1 Tax=Paraflavitalea devenefica TaxID=2716334 RepID=UPI001422631E|nr:TIGR03435 family protein [Paraflavitalea devenefica]NII25320.1 TIGR03435 family protein [Paraflavitalea devenefica]
MRIPLFVLLVVFCGLAQAQPVLKAGDLFPDVIIRPIINAPVKSLAVHAPNKKFLILNFWSTACGSCYPEMDSLAKLQVKNGRHVQVIAIADDPVSRLQKYLTRKPSILWLASDTSFNLYRQFAFVYLGQSAILDQQHRIVALVRTDSINQSLIDRLVRNEKIRSSAETGNGRGFEAETFTVDSTIGFQVTWSGYRTGLNGMTKLYWQGPFKGRRRSYVNLCLSDIYRETYDVSEHQIVYEVPKKSICEWENKSTRYCFDLIVKPEQKDSLFVIMKQLLHQLFPIKARLEKREMPVYVLHKLPATKNWQESVATESTYGFSGRGFTGKGVILKPFVDYVGNVLELPLVDETGLTGKYDIVTENAIPSKEDVLASIQKIGLVVEKGTRVIDVLIIYK